MINYTYKDEKYLIKAYVEDKIKIEDIAKECNTTTDTIYRWLDCYKIQRRTSKSKEVSCLNCKKHFKKLQCEINKGSINHYCSQECCKEYRKNNIKIMPNYKEENSFKCNYCGKDIRVNKSKQERNAHNFCNRECFSKWVSENKTGKNASNYKNALLYKICPICNNEFTTYYGSQIYCSVKCKSIIQMNRKILTCSNCNFEFERTASEIYWANQRGCENIFCSTKCKQGYHIGKNHPSYIEDRSLLKAQNKSIRWSKEMCDWRKTVYKRDNYTCKMCGNRSSIHNAVVLNSHHIVRFTDNTELRFDASNGVTLCEDCHKLTYGKEKQFEEQFKKLQIINNK